MQPADLPKRAKRELDAKVVDIEMTLIAIIQAVPLVLLAEKAAEPITRMDWQVLPYLGVGLLTVLLFWSRAVIHTLSFISWPLDFTHNFLYVLSTLVQSVLVAQLSNPRDWYALWIVYTAILWLTYAVDLRMIRGQMKNSREANDRLLLADVLQDQLRNVRFYMPVGFLFSVAAFLAVRLNPGTFLDGHWHIALVTGQLIVGAAYLWEGYLILRRRNERILQRQAN